MAFFNIVVSALLMTSVLALNPRQTTGTISAAPSPTANTVCENNFHYIINHGRRYFCPGVVDGINGTDISDACCCVGAIYTTGVASTHWWYNYSTALPSTVMVPTSCVLPIPLTASDYDAQATAAIPTPTWSPSIVLGYDHAFATPTATATAVMKVSSDYTVTPFTGGSSQTSGVPVGVLVLLATIVSSMVLL